MVKERESLKIRRGKTLLVIMVALLVVVGVFLFFGGSFRGGGEVAKNQEILREAEVLDLGKDFSEFSVVRTTEDSEIMETGSGEKYIVDPKKIRGGGPPKGGIGVDRGIPAIISSHPSILAQHL